MDNNLSSYVVFFDIGDTLGFARVSPPPEYLLEGLDVYSYIPSVIKQLKDNNIRLGIISNTGDNPAETVDRVLEEAGLLKFFESNLRIYSAEVGLKKNSPEIFQLAARQAGKSDHPEQCLYVGEDSTERSYAVEAGWHVAPHPILAWDIINGDSIRFVRVSVPANQSQQKWRSQISKLSVVPLNVTGKEGTKVYAIASNNSIMRLDDLGFEVDRLGNVNQPLTKEVYLLRDDRQVRTGFLNPEGQSSSFLSSQEESQWVLASTPEGLYLALPGGRSIEEYHFEEAYHGHNLKLLPDLTLLEPFGEGNNTRTATFLRVPTVEPSLSEAQLAKLREITAESIRGYLERYTGVKPLNGDREYKIKSRHIHHPDMTLVTDTLAKDLQKIGGESFAVRMHRFVHEGRILDNVEAELPGSDSDEIVLVTAHLDSTAAFSDHAFDPETDSSPGADDDASGVAGVLAIANTIKQIAEVAPPKRTIRFVLFNAEEHGLVGSKAYARNQAALDTPIVAVYQMDMIGYNVKPPRSFEVHVGYFPAPEVEARSLVLAERINRLAPELSPNLQLPQIYTQPDPAEGRSDHASFHDHGYAACTTSEDFFAGPQPSSPTAEPNPNYHKDQDTFVDLEYAADIARLIAAATLVTANL